MLLVVEENKKLKEEINSLKIIDNTRDQRIDSIENRTRASNVVVKGLESRGEQDLI